MLTCKNNNKYRQRNRIFLLRTEKIQLQNLRG